MRKVRNLYFKDTFEFAPFYGHSATHIFIDESAAITKSKITYEDWVDRNGNRFEISPDGWVRMVNDEGN